MESARPKAMDALSLWNYRCLQPPQQLASQFSILVTELSQKRSPRDETKAGGIRSRAPKKAAKRAIWPKNEKDEAGWV